MSLYQIWGEGWAGHVAQGDYGLAKFWGCIEAETFTQACNQLAQHDPEFAKYYNPAQLTHWSCRLFDNEHDARGFERRHGLS